VAFKEGSARRCECVSVIEISSLAAAVPLFLRYLISGVFAPCRRVSGRNMCTARKKTVLGQTRSTISHPMPPLRASSPVGGYRNRRDSILARPESKKASTGNSGCTRGPEPPSSIGRCFDATTKLIAINKMNTIPSEEEINSETQNSSFEFPTTPDLNLPPSLRRRKPLAKLATTQRVAASFVCRRYGAGEELVVGRRERRMTIFCKPPLLRFSRRAPPKP